MLIGAGNSGVMADPHLQAPCAGTVAPIAPSYRCLNGTCVEHTVGKNTGVFLTWA